MHSKPGSCLRHPMHGAWLLAALITAACGQSKKGGSDDDDKPTPTPTTSTIDQAPSCDFSSTDWQAATGAAGWKPISSEGGPGQVTDCDADEDDCAFFDTTTSLIWSEPNPGAQGKADWPTADQACKDLSFAGTTQWTLPSAADLSDARGHTIYDLEPNTAFWGDGGTLWSSTKSNSGGSTTATTWNLDENGTTGEYTLDNKLAYRCISRVLNYCAPVGAWTPVERGTALGLQAAQSFWTGSKLLAVGGFSGSMSIAIYDPSTSTWTAGSSDGAPSLRGNYSAVWTGTELIVWGGSSADGKEQSGGVYTLATDTWRATSTTGAPQARIYHTAVWTGSRMIVWGGEYSLAAIYNDGAAYNPEDDTWSPIATAPSYIQRSAAFWTGSQMIVWGTDQEPDNGEDRGLLYDPTADTWATFSDSPVETGTTLPAAFIGDSLYVATDNKIAAYKPGGSWKALQSNLPFTGIDRIAALGERVFAYASASGIGVVYDPATGSWYQAAAREHVNGTADSTAQLVSIGDEVLFWSPTAVVTEEEFPLAVFKP